MVVGLKESCSRYIAVPEPEGQLEPPRYVARVVLACPPQPLAQLRPDRRNSIDPHTVNGRRKIGVVTAGHFLNDLIENVVRTVQILSPNGQQLGRAKSREQLELDVMN
jgi:hypothetical protein